MFTTLLKRTSLPIIAVTPKKYTIQEMKMLSKRKINFIAGIIKRGKDSYCKIGLLSERRWRYYFQLTGSLFNRKRGI